MAGAVEVVVVAAAGAAATAAAAAAYPYCRVGTPAAATGSRSAPLGLKLHQPAEAAVQNLKS